MKCVVVDGTDVALEQVVGSRLDVVDVAETWVPLVSMTSQEMKLCRKNVYFVLQIKQAINEITC